MSSSALQIQAPSWALPTMDWLSFKWETCRAMCSLWALDVRLQAAGFENNAFAWKKNWLDDKGGQTHHGSMGSSGSEVADDDDDDDDDDQVCGDNAEG